MLPALIGVILGLLLRFAIRAVQQRNRTRRGRSPLPTPQPWKPPQQGKPVLRGVEGYYAGTVVEMTGEPLTLGRDARAANLVLPADADSISQRHCVVSYEAGRFLVEDCWSTNGTFLMPGEKLEPGQARPLTAGERFFLGDNRNVFEVSFE